jgi:hypothetical protein
MVDVDWQQHRRERAGFTDRTSELFPRWQRQVNLRRVRLNEMPVVMAALASQVFLCTVFDGKEPPSLEIVGSM